MENIFKKKLLVLVSSCDSKNAPENIFISFDLHRKSLIFQVAAVQAVVKVVRGRQRR